MRPAAVLLSSSLVSHSCTSRSLLGILIAFLFIPTSLIAQSDTIKSSVDSVIIVADTSKNIHVRIIPIYFMSLTGDYNYYHLTPEQKKKRTWFIGTANVVGYSGVMIALSSAWYSQYDKTKFSYVQ